MVMSFTNKQLSVYDDEEALSNRPPIFTFEFSQIYTVRTLNPGEHEIMRVKQSDLKRILMVRPPGGLCLLLPPPFLPAVLICILPPSLPPFNSLSLPLPPPSPPPSSPTSSTPPQAPQRTRRRKSSCRQDTE